MRAGGFTLVELLVAMVILGALMALLAPALPLDRPAAAVKTAARDIAAGLRHTRSQAIAQNRPERFTIDVAGRAYRAGAGGAARGLRPDLELSLQTASADVIDANSGHIRFFPDGSSTGGAIAIAHRTARARVTVDWLTGRVTVEE